MATSKHLHFTIDLSRSSFDNVMVSKTRRDLMKVYTSSPDSCQTTKDILRSGIVLIEELLHNTIQAVHRLMRSALDQELVKHNAISRTPATYHWTTNLLAPVTITHEHTTSQGTETLVVTISLSRIVAGRITRQLDKFLALVTRCLPRTSPVFKLDSRQRDIILLIAYFGDMDNEICAERLTGACEFKTGMFTSEAIRGVKILQDLWTAMYGSMSMDCADGVQQRALVTRYATILLEIYESMRGRVTDEDDFAEDTVNDDDEELIDCLDTLEHELTRDSSPTSAPKDNNMHDCLGQSTSAEQRQLATETSHTEPKETLPKHTLQLLAGLIVDYLATAGDHYTRIEADQLTKRRNKRQKRCVMAR